MARVNEKEAPHQLEYLDYRLTCTRYVEGLFKWKYYWCKRKTWDHSKRVRKRVYLTDNHPVGLNYFTVRQILYILNDIREHYFRETHIFAFGQEKFLIRLIPDKDDEINDYVPPKPRRAAKIPYDKKCHQVKGGLKKVSRR